ncbi:hypothetical protein [Staphylococcus simulans]|uniref:hypothetical protein n=1 Tax=Staphylococcus simulans TaxID=1286 RepID=UPI000D03242A|nr:hypothetical protein [Staphylococcus simulans]
MKFIKDMMINILSQGLFIAVQQLFLFPDFEKSLGQEDFGRFLIIYGFFNVFVITLNASFTNLYQKKFNTFTEELENKDALYIYYKKLLTYITLISVAFSFSILILDIGIVEYLLLYLLVLFTSSRMFLLVHYRVKKDFIKILYVNLVLSSMYVSLYILHVETVRDILLYFVAIELVINIFVFVILKIDILSLIKSKKYQFENSALTFLLISGCAGSLMNYSDRFITSFLIGAGSVSVFYIATLPTKLMLFPFTMISSVILSYIADTEKITRLIKKRVLILLPIVSLVVFAVSYFVGYILIYFLYNDYLESIKTIYIFVTITFGLICADYIIRSFLVKYYSLQRKALIDILTLVFFIALSFAIFTIEQSLVAIAIAQLVTYSIKLIVQLYIFSKLKV